MKPNHYINGSLQSAAKLAFAIVMLCMVFIANVRAQTAPGLTLDKSWDTPMQGGTNTMDDLAKLFSTVAKSSVKLAADDQIVVYEGIRYLTPIQQAFTALNLGQRLPSKVLVACPGFPRNSFYYYAVDGRFEDGFNRMYLVVDRADQLVSVQLVEESPRGSAQSWGSDADWHTYNFVNARSKSSSTVTVRHRIHLAVGSEWFINNYGNLAYPLNRKTTDWTALRLDSWLLAYGPRGSTYKMEPKERVSWFVPRPIVELILTCVQKAGR